ncbi:MAG: HlyC/CorC family transporter [Proteobacteria bacterium]|nr:HlyC/CorC family transporter [Pseudomonadota bacterium]
MTIIAIVALLLLSAFFSGSETALTASSRARIHQLSQEGSPRAEIVEELKSDTEKLIGTILLGNNAVNILATALTTSLFSGLFGEYAVAIATGVMTVMVLIFAEVLPKTFAIRNPERSAMAVGPIIRPIVFVLAPITAAVQAVVRGTLHIFGINIGASTHVLSAHDELRGAISLHAQEGTMNKPHKDMLGGILDLDHVDVSEVMIHRRAMDMIDIDLGAEAIIQHMVASNHTRVPLWRDEPENIVGVLHAKDLLRAARAKNGPLAIDDIQTIATEPWFVPETTTLRQQLNAFRKRRAHFALVVDEYGALEGVVTLEDIIEEIVGEIADEHDQDAEEIRRQADGRLIVEGTTTIRDLNREMDWDLSDDHAITIAGYVIDHVQSIPEPGQMFIYDGIKFEILKRHRNQITLLRITPPDPDDADG